MAVSAAKHKHWNEMVGLTLLAAGLLISLSLISYSATDPSFSVSGAGLRTNNFIGVIGAYLSDALLRLFGVTAYLFPFFLFGYGVFCALGAKAEHPLLKKIGGLVLFFSSASFLSLQGDTARLFGEVVPSGGMLGSLVSHLLVSGFSAAGSYIITVTALIISLMLLTPFSPLKMIAWLRVVYGRFSDQTDMLIEIYRGRREKAREAKQQRLEHPREKPVIVESQKPQAPAQPKIVKLERPAKAVQQSLPGMESEGGKGSYELPP